MLARVPWSRTVETSRRRDVAKPKRLNRDRRRYLVDLVAAILKRGDPTPFAFEATCRHALRSRLCLAGWGWQEADTVAADIVAVALNRIGARRPSWAEGQPEWVQNGAGALIERTRCVRCHGPLPEGHTKFCGQLCAGAHFMTLDRIKRAEDAAAYDRVAGARKWDHRDYD